MEAINSVYRFINKNNEIIYIGQAKNLKNRLNNHNHLPKECYEEIERIEYIEFETEDDMGFAEKYFISKNKPKYNVANKNKDITVIIEEFEKKEWIKLEKQENNDNKINIFEDVELNDKMNWILANIDELKKILEENQIKNFREIQLTYNLRGDYQRTSIRISEEIFEQWLEFKEEWFEYKSQELVTQALVEFMENHPKY